MKTHLRLLGLFLLVTSALVTVSCDTKKGGAGSGDPLTTNFSVNLTSLIEAVHGLPDSIVAQIQVDGGGVRTVVLDPSKISESGLIHFPVEAAEGSKVEVVYKVWKDGGVVGAGTVKWVSGEALAVPRPNIAPSVSIDSVPEGMLLVRRNAKIWVHTSSRDPEGSLSSLLMDWNGDGVMDDSLVPPKGQDSIQVSWGAPGTYRVSARVVDKAGLFRLDTLTVRVLAAATVRCTAPDSASLNDSVSIAVQVVFDDSAQAKDTRLVWRLAGAAPESTGLRDFRTFLWANAGIQQVIVSTVDALGEIDRDTVVVRILQDAPVLDLGNFPGAVDLNTITSLPIHVQQSFGTIVSWGVDFGGHPESDSWDTIGTGPIASISHVFTNSGDPRIRVWVQDDDGNRVVKTGTLTVNASTSGAMLRRTSSQDTTVSIHDTVVVQFARNFAPGAEAAARVEWSIDGVLQPPVAVAVRRTFVWPESGLDHFAAWRLVTPAGATTWDTVNVRVLKDAPVLELSKFPRSVGLDMWSTFRPSAQQTWGRIVRWGMDFDGDTTDGWDTIATGGFDTLDHVFDREGSRIVRVFADDDDGNHSVDSARILVQAIDVVLVQRLSSDSETVSIGDPVPVRFRLSFPSFAMRKASRMEWTFDGSAPESLAVDTLRNVSWTIPGRHVVRMRTVGPLGATSTDSIVVHVVLGVPTVDLSAFPDTAGSGSRTLLRPMAYPVFGEIVQWKIDFDGDTASGWDSVATGAVPREIFHSFSGEGDSLVRVWVMDDDGNSAVSDRRIQVVKGAYGLIQVRMSTDTTVSIGDTAWVRLYPGFADLAEQSRSRLVWKIDGAQPETLQVVTGRGFIWPNIGQHQITFRAIGEFGATNWDTLRVKVVLDPPVIDFGIPDAISRNAVVAFLPGAHQKFGTIAAWGIDLDGDTTAGWDVTGAATFKSVSHIFSVPGVARVLMWAQDDDGNRTVSTKDVEVRAGSGAVLLLQDERQRERTVSIRDTVPVDLAVNFPAEFRDQYRILWSLDGGAVESTAVLTTRPFRWDVPGDHRIAFQSAGPVGSSSWDSVLVHVLQDVPSATLGDLPVQPTRNAITLFTPGLADGLGRIVRWGVDFDGDTAKGWDFVDTGTAQRIGHIFPKVGAAHVLVFAEDDDGNRTLGTKDLVVKAGRGAVSSLTADSLQASIRDSVLIKLALAFPTGGDLQNQYSLEWKIDAQASEVKGIVENRLFVWNAPGSHVVRFRAVGGPWGDASWDSVVVQVVQGVPRILNIYRNGSGVNSDITFSANVDPVFGSIVLGRWDWDNNGTWDAEVSNPAAQGATTKFASSSPQLIHFQATDDDGNVVDTLVTFSAQNSPPSFGALTFATSTVGMRIANTLQASIADLNGLGDLDSLKIDWEADGKYDTSMAVGGLSSVNVSHAWATAGTKNLQLLLTDKSGEPTLGTISLVVTADAPVVSAIEPNRAAYRLGDPILLTARATDASVRSDYDRIAWDFEGDGTVDTIVSLVGSVGSVSTQMAWSSRTPGAHQVCATVRDLIGNSGSRCTTLTVTALPPKVFAHLTDSVPMATDTSRIWIDSIVTRALSGVQSHYTEIWWMPQGGSWTKWGSAEFQALNAAIRIPAKNPSWYVVVKAIQDNGEVGLDTIRARVLDVFVDKRDGMKYPIVDIGGQRWMGRNLNWTPINAYADSVSSVCDVSDPDCSRYGRLYSRPVFVPNANYWDRDSLVIQSVCPDGWHVPSRADWNVLRSSLETANPSVGWAVSLRDRKSWGAPLPGQIAPGDFDGLSVRGSASFWTSGIPSENVDNWPEFWNSAVVLTSQDQGNGTYGGLYYSSVAERNSIRCLANDRIRLGAARTYKDGMATTLGYSMVFAVHGIPKDTTDVTVKVETIDGSRTTTMPAYYFGGSDGPTGQAAAVNSAVFTTAGPQKVIVTATQSGSSVRDTIHVNPVVEFRDARDGTYYHYVKWGGLRWMTEDLAYDTANTRAFVNAQFDAAGMAHPRGTIYPLATVLAGQARSPHGTSGPRGVCPEGWRLPSSADWQALIDAAPANGLDPNKAFRAWDPGDGSVAWTSMKAGTNSSGLNVGHTGYLEGTDTYRDISIYWGGDQGGRSPANATYGLIQYDNDDAPYTDDGSSDMYAAVRCVSSLP